MSRNYSTIGTPNENEWFLKFLVESKNMNVNAFNYKVVEKNYEFFNINSRKYPSWWNKHDTNKGIGFYLTFMFKKTI